MGTCIICGKPAPDDQLTCASHEEDVAFEFRGNRPGQLVSGRYYRGTVDGFADFGVFVDIGDHVTGLLHKSELDQRLESLDWEPGDDVYVQVRNVHDNGNVDLGWSVRQDAREFRGRLVHDPDHDPTVYRPAEEEGAADESPVTSTPSPRASGTRGASRDGSRDAEAETPNESPTPGESEAARDGAETEDEDENEAESGGETEATDPADVERVTTETLDDLIEERVRLEGEITDIRQTGGPTVFSLTDESGTVDCAAFEAAGVRAYPEVEVDDVVAIVGTVERHRGAVQVETESLTHLGEEETLAVRERLDAALDEQATPSNTDLLVDDPDVEAVHDGVVEAATAIRRAVSESRPVVVRHTATVDGYVAGAAVERAVLPLVESAHAAADAAYHFVRRKPLGEDDPYYDMDAATGDVTAMLEDAARHGEKYPLFVLAGTGATRESLDGLEFLDTYDAPAVVVDGELADEAVVDTAAVTVATPDAPSGVLAANVAACVDDDARDALSHLPAVCYWEDVPERYLEAAAENGYDAETLTDLREAIALEAYYQSYNGKRELVRDLFWEGESRELAAHVAGQFRAKLEDELDTASPHVETRDVAGVRVATLDAEAYAHRFSFPPTGLLLDALHRDAADETPRVSVCVDTDELRLRSTHPIDVRELGETVADACPEAGVRARGGRDGRIAFLGGERDAVVDATVEAVADAVREATGAATAER